MYEEFYGFKEKPFSLTPDPKFFFLSEHHRAAFEHLLYGIREKEGFLLITGEVGTGKTTLCRALLEKVGGETNTALILNPTVSDEELLRTILTDFGLKVRGRTKKELVDELNRFLLEEQTKGKSSVLIIDEAQNLSPQVLEEIRLLSNLETEKEKLLQIILIGQPELKHKLEFPGLRQLNQRISIRYTLQPLRKREVPRYIQHRLALAGASGILTFTRGAIWVVYVYSKGIPRLINLVCDRALLGGYARETHRITTRIAREGIKSLKGDYGEGKAPGWRLALWGAAFVILCAALGISLISSIADFGLSIDNLWPGWKTSPPISKQSVRQQALPSTPPALTHTPSLSPGEQDLPLAGATPETHLPLPPQGREELSAASVSEAKPSGSGQRPELSAASVSDLGEALVSEHSEPSPQSGQRSEQVRAAGAEGPFSEELRAKSPEPKKSSKPSEGSKLQDRPYTVQVASSPTEDEALNEVEAAKKLGYPVFLARTAQSGGGTQYRIFLGRFASYREAEAVQRKLQQQRRFSSAFVVNAAKRWEENEPHR